MTRTKVMTILLMTLLAILLLSCSEIVFGSNGDTVKEVIMKEPGIPVSSFKVEKMIEETLFADPISGTIDDQGNIYIVDRKLVKLFKLSREGKLLNSIERKGTGPGDLSTPVLIKFRDNKLYAFDFQLPYINIFDKDLKIIEQKRLTNLRSPSDVEFIGDAIIVSSGPMQMFMNHRLFLYSADGEMKEKLFPDEKNDPSKIIKGKIMMMKIPDLLFYDPTSENLWCAAVAPYEITVFNKKLETIKILRGDKTFKFVDQEAGGGQVIFKRPEDMGFFFTGKNGKMFYGYKFDNEVYLDVIENDRIIKRFKSKEIRRILYQVTQNTFLVSFLEGKEDAEPAVGIVSIEL